MRRWGRCAVAAAVVALAAVPVRGGETDDSPARSEIVRALEAGDHPTALGLIDAYLAGAPDDAVMIYNAACACARTGDLDRADALLLRALKAGFKQFSWMRRDPDLGPLRDRARYRAILAARDAADPVLALRRVQQWERNLESDAYRHETDATRRLDYLTALEGPDLDDVKRVVEPLADHLTEALFDVPLRGRVLVVIPTPADARRLFSDPHVHGRYRHEARELIAADTGRSLRHEMVHALHENHMDERGQTHPIWIEEGLACLFESASFDEQGRCTFQPNERDAIAHDLAARGELPRWRDLFALPDRAFLSDPAVHYAVCRSIFAFLADEDRLGAFYHVYTDRFDEDPSGALALEVVSGRGLEETEAAWIRWLEENGGTAVPAAESDALAAEAVGPSPALAEEVAAAVLEAKADDAAREPVAETARRDRIAWMLAEGQSLYAAGRYDAAIERLREAIDLDTGAADARYQLGLAYVRTDDVAGACAERDALTRLDPSLASLLANLLANLQSPRPPADAPRDRNPAPFPLR